MRMSPEDHDFEMDEETDYLLQPADDSMRLNVNRYRRINACSKFFKHFLCGYVLLHRYDS